MSISRILTIRKKRLPEDMKSRTKARAIALQALYEYDLTYHPVGLILQNRFEEETDSDEKMRKFASEIVQGVFPIVEQLDHIIANHAPEWPLDQVASIDRNIIRIALWEFAVAKCTPVKVAINEAVELAKVFGSDSTPRFINGVLGSLVTKYENYRIEIESLNQQGS
jgi:N utilization substance protein B